MFLIILRVLKILYCGCVYYFLQLDASLNFKQISKQTNSEELLSMRAYDPSSQSILTALKLNIVLILGLNYDIVTRHSTSLNFWGNNDWSF